jgi:hypothetical protein
MPQTYYYHTSQPDVRIKVTKKTVTWERNEFVNFDTWQVAEGKEPEKAWKYYMRHTLPVTNAETLRSMYNLPDDVVARLKGN